MKQYVIIGLDVFGRRMLEELSQFDAEILIIDKSKERVDQFRDIATESYIADVINEDVIRKLIPDNIDAAIIDLGRKIEVSILVTNYLKKMGVRKIVAKAESGEHGEILEVVGATEVIFPNQEAAKRIAPLILSSSLFNYLPISKGLVLAEVGVPEQYDGKTLIDANLRQSFGLNVVAIRSIDSEYEFFTPDYPLSASDVLLVVGKEEHVASFSGGLLPSRKKGLSALFKRRISKEKNG
jgi:trk system potassium uptake protein